MKKIMVILILLMAGVLYINAAEKEPCDPKTFSITLGVGVRNFTEDRFKEVYEDTPLIYSVDLAVRVLRPLEVFLHTDYLSKEGQWTFTQEKIKLKIIPVELGARFLVGSKKSCQQKLFPYLGAGIGYYMIKEEYEAATPIESVDEKKVGFFAEGGLRFYAIKSVFIDAKLKFITVKLEGSEGNIQVGGLAYMGGIGFSF